MISFPKLLLLLFIVLLLFGATRLPAIGSGLGGMIRSFRDGLKGDEEPEQPAALDKKKNPE